VSFAAAPRRPSSGGRPARRRSPIGIAIAVVGALVVLLLLLAQFWTEVLWFRQLDFANVLWTQWGARIALFVGGFLVMGGLVFLSFSLAYRSRPIYAPSTPEQATLDQYREAIEPLRKVVMIVAPALVGFFAGAAAASQWQTVLLAMNSVPFGTTDPQWGIDLSFYVFTLPALRFVVSFLMAVVIIAGIAAVATHYLYGGLRVGGGSDAGPRTTTAARVQLSVTAALLLVLIGANYWLDRYSILTSGGAKFDGASYADVHAVIPSKAILTLVALFVAALFVVTAVRGNWRLPAIGVGLMVVSAIAIGGIYPSVVQRFQVTPNAQDFEEEYIQRNIDATKAAYGIDDVQTEQYNAKTEAEAGALREDADTTASIRLLDPEIVSPSFSQLQQNKQYYQFSPSLSVDRYTIDDESRDTVIAVRELNQEGLGADARNWVNDHTVYTHGFGVVAAYGNQIGPDGRPAFYEGSIPSTGAFTDAGGYEPRIYFSPEAPQYSIVGAPEGTDPWELDYPVDDDAGQVSNTFPTQDVAAGPSVGSFMNKVLYALKFGSEQILFSDRVTEESQILYDRSPRDRVAKVAPYLTLDGRVYPAVVDGRVKWIVDGYTTSNAYPYSTSESLEDSTRDSLVAANSVEALAPQQVNYIRNSVKATVDAYDGTVKLYQWDETDPILKTWMKVFPDSVTPKSEISDELMAHLRYPEDLFKVQRYQLAKYHVENAGEFYSGNNRWEVPEDPNAARAVFQPPYRLFSTGVDDTKDWSLTSVFKPRGAQNTLTSYLQVNSDATSEGFGKLRLLEMADENTPGPGQVANEMQGNDAVAQKLQQYRVAGATPPRFGNLLTLPVNGGLIYIQPVYAARSATSAFPILQYVIVKYGARVGIDRDLPSALADALGVKLGGAETPVDPTPGEEPGEETPEEPDLTLDQQIAAQLTKADDAFKAAEEAQSKGETVEWARQLEIAQTAVEEAVKLADQRDAE
jgi:uncharacterized membrane protein (UPF0182 family)